MSGQLIKWISNFLSDRSQITREGDSLSSATKLCSGVVQGSVIGLLLFVLFINDITQIFSDKNWASKLYADDLKLYTVLHADEDCGNLQDKLNDIYDWSHNWQLGISHKKCNLMYIGNTNCKPSLLLNNACLYSSHGRGQRPRCGSCLIRKNIVRARVRANSVHKCFISRDAFTLIRAFKVYVTPILEYASCTWSLHHILKIQKVETVQTKFTKRLPGYAPLCYKERLSRLDLDSLEMRQLRHDLLYSYWIVFNLVSDSVELQMICSHLLTLCIQTRGHPYKLYLHNIFSVNVLSLPGTICLPHQNTFLVFLNLNVLLTRSI